MVRINTNPEPNNETMQPITNRQDFIDAAYSEMAKGEGRVLRPYVCTGGHPTIGVGKLFLSKNILNDTEAVERYKKQYMKFPLYDASGNKMTPEQKGKEFDNLVTAMKNGTMKTSGGTPNYITYPQLGQIKESGAKQIFTNTCNFYLDKIEKDYGKEKFYNYSKSLQFSLLHCYMGGGSKRLQKLKQLGEEDNNVVVAQNLTQIFEDHGSAIATRNMAYQAVSDTTQIARNQEPIIPIQTQIPRVDVQPLPDEKEAILNLQNQPGNTMGMIIPGSDVQVKTENTENTNKDALLNQMINDCNEATIVMHQLDIQLNQPTPNKERQSEKTQEIDLIRMQQYNNGGR